MRVTDDDEIILISAIEHYSYCPRQYALIHLEQVYEENVFTLQGTAQHERAHEETTTFEEGMRVERALPLWSEHFGLLGKGDVVEFHDDGLVMPVEYKHGAKRERKHDELQICAQALCLEEMLGVTVAAGAIFYHGSQRRREVAISPALRAATTQAIAEMRELARNGITPPPVNDARCENCSLNAVCQPALLGQAARLSGDPLYRLPPEEE